MSIESVTERIAAIQDRIRTLSGAGAPAALLADNRAPAVASAATAPADPSVLGAFGVKPFDVALAQANGSTSLRPIDNLGGQIDRLVAKYSGQYGVDPKLVSAVIKAESDGNTRCVSNKGAMGLMQLMPEEVRGYGVSDPFDPEQNIAAGVRQLSDKLKTFNGDVPLALAAYNAGSGAVKKYGGIPPYPETQNYVKKILSSLGR